MTIDSASDRHPYRGTTQPLGMVTAMDPVALLDYLKDRLQQAGRQDISDISQLDSPGVRVDCPDGVRVFAKVAWYGRADQQPHQPSWPSREDLTRAGARR